MDPTAANAPGIVKFVLLTHPRSGSTLLSLALRAHPEIRMFGELFNDESDERICAFEAGYRSRPSIARYLKYIRGGAYVRGWNSAEFIERQIYFDPSNDRPPATGFKLFYEQARSDLLNLRFGTFLKATRENTYYTFNTEGFT